MAWGSLSGRLLLRIPAVLHLMICLLALHWSADEQVGAQPILTTSRRDTPSADTTDHEVLFEDLPEGFHDDVDSITIAVGGHHTCALEYRPGVDFGGPVRCWGRNDWGQSSPSDDIFVQVGELQRRASGCKQERDFAEHSSGSVVNMPAY